MWNHGTKWASVDMWTTWVDLLSLPALYFPQHLKEWLSFFFIPVQCLFFVAVVSATLVNLTLSPCGVLGTVCAHKRITVKFLNVSIVSRNGLKVEKEPTAVCTTFDTSHFSWFYVIFSINVTLQWSTVALLDLWYKNYYGCTIQYWYWSSVQCQLKNDYQIVSDII